MKKVEFIKYGHYTYNDLKFLSDDIISKYFEAESGSDAGWYNCIKTFSVEVTVKTIQDEEI